MKTTKTTGTTGTKYMKNRVRGAALLIALLTLFTFISAGCGSAETSGGEQTKPFGGGIGRQEVRLALLSGSTGLGAAKLICDAKKGTAANDYQIDVITEPTEALAGFRAGKYDLAALPVNLAAKLCSMGDPETVVIAVNTLGVLYLLENETESVHAVSDLRGKTVYTTGQGATPQYILEHVLLSNGLTADDVQIVYRATADELQADLTEKGALVMAPEPKATVLTKSITTARYALDMTEEWNKHSETPPVQGCIVANAAFCIEHPTALASFLEEYAGSVAAVNLADDAAAGYVVEAGLIGKAPIAKAAIPRSNLVVYTGNEMKRALSGTYDVLYSLAPASVGGKLPGDDFYFGADR